MVQSNISTKLFGKSQNVVVVCKKNNPEQVLLDISSDLSKKFKRICIVTVNKPFSYIAQKMAERGIDFSKFYFIDCVSTSLFKQIVSKQCVYITSPKALTELAIALNNLPKDVDLVIIDSLSGLSFYNDKVFTLRFLNSITSKFRKVSLKSIYLTIGKSNSAEIADLSLLVDKVIDI